MIPGPQSNTTRFAWLGPLAVQHWSPPPGLGIFALARGKEVHWDHPAGEGSLANQSSCGVGGHHKWRTDLFPFGEVTDDETAGFQ